LFFFTINTTSLTQQKHVKHKNKLKTKFIGKVYTESNSDRKTEDANH